MFEELRSDFKNEIGALRRECGLKAEETQQIVQDLSAQVAKDKEIWLANQENHAKLSEEFNYVVGTIREDKDIMTGSLQRIQTELDQSKVAFTKALEAQTHRLNDHDTKLQQQQDASFFGSKNSMEKLEDYKERHDTLNTRVLQMEDWIRAQAPKNHAVNYTSSSAAEGSRYIPPNERPRANPRVGAQKAPQFTLGASSSRTPPRLPSPCSPRITLKGTDALAPQGMGTPDDPIVAYSSSTHKNVGQAPSFSAWHGHDQGADSAPVTAADWRQLISSIVKEHTG